MTRGKPGLRVSLQPQGRKRSRSLPGSRGWSRRSGWSWLYWTYLTCPRTSWPARHRSKSRLSVCGGVQACAFGGGQGRSGASGVHASPSACLHLSRRLQDLTARDLEKQEREQAANSLEAFIFETQVGRVDVTLALGLCLGGSDSASPSAGCTSPGQAVPTRVPGSVH